MNYIEFLDYVRVGVWNYTNAGYTPGVLRTSSYNTLLKRKIEIDSCAW